MLIKTIRWVVVELNLFDASRARLARLITSWLNCMYSMFVYEKSVIELGDYKLQQMYEKEETKCLFKWRGSRGLPLTLKSFTYELGVMLLLQYSAPTTPWLKVCLSRSL